MIVIALLYNRQATDNLIAMAERQNVATDRILSNTIWDRFDDFFVAAAEMDGETLRSHPETADIRTAIGAATEGMRIVKVKIYSAGGLTIFSHDPEDIGEIRSDSAAIRAAVDDGLTSSKLTFEDRVSAFSGEAFNRDVVETYVPRRDAAGKVIGVFELYADVTDVKEHIDDTTIRLSLGIAVIFAIVYAVLVIGVVRRAIVPIKLASQRAAEIGPDKPGVRLQSKGMPREILPLLRAINAALSRLDQALDAQRRFTADAAHELLTPLAVLRAQIDSVEDGAATEQLRRDVDAMTHIVQQLLLLSELESSGKPPDIDEAADLHGVTVDVIAHLAPLAVRDRKELSLEGAPGPVMVRGQASMLSLVLRNLIENAIRHTPPDTTVEIDIDTDGRVRVTDHGNGVPPDQHEDIFQRFWRGDRRRGKGAGLGLSIVKRIVEMVGGHVRVENASHGGARFILELRPAHRRDEANKQVRD